MESTAKPEEFAEAGSTIEPPVIDPVHSNATADQILSEQVRQLYERGRAGSITVFVALIGLWMPFSFQLPAWTILPPLLTLALAQYNFNTLRNRYHGSPDRDQDPRRWAELYARGSLLSGSTWGIAAVLWLPTASFPHQALFCLVVAALCLNSILTRHVYPRSLIAYTLTSVGPLLATLAWTGTMETMVTAGLGMMAWSVASSGMHSLFRSSEEAIALRFEKNALIDRLAESTVIAEQKARDAEASHAVARKAARSRRDFLSMVTHEIRSPLASLSGLVDLLSATDLDDSQKSYANGVQESSRLLNRLVDDLSDLTEMEALSIRLRPVDMSPLKIAEAAVHLMRHEAAAHRLSIEIDDLPDTPAVIHNDPDRVKQTLVNLITRALRTTENGGVMIRLSPVHLPGEAAGVRFSVTDTGKGMPSEEASRLFSSDHYDDNSGQHRRQDVNLTICDRLVRLMGGRIGADSNEGSGFTAWFILGSNLESKNDLATAPVARPLSGQVLDLDRVYEIEQELGTGRIADHLDEAIDAIAKVQKSLAQACLACDLGGARHAADELSALAQKIGLTGLAETASSLFEHVNGATSQSKLNEKAEQLDSQFRAGAHALARAYPALAR